MIAKLFCNEIHYCKCWCVYLGGVVIAKVLIDYVCHCEVPKFYLTSGVVNANMASADAYQHLSCQCRNANMCHCGIVSATKRIADVCLVELSMIICITVELSVPQCWRVSLWNCQCHICITISCQCRSADMCLVELSVPRLYHCWVVSADISCFKQRPHSLPTSCQCTN